MESHDGSEEVMPYFRETRERVYFDSATILGQLAA